MSNCPKCGHTGIHPADLNRRAEVEQRLLDAASGKKPIPTAEECRALALQLGVPAEFGPQHRDLVHRAKDALNGMVGLVQLVSGSRYPDFPVDNHRVIEAQSCAAALERYSEGAESRG